jgi:hypothetical protein
MTTKVKPLARLVLPRPPALTPPWTTEERLQHIEAMMQRVNGYVKFMCQVSTPNAASPEEKEKAVMAFHDQMVVLEHQLARIHDEFQLK